MIQDAQALNGIRESWRTVRTIDGMIRASLNAPVFSLVPAAARGGLRKAQSLRTAAESLLLLFAVSVLEDTLKKLHDEGAFRCKSKGLKQLMKASKAGQAALPWRDFCKVDEARDRRNKVAHRREFLAAWECASYLAALARELVAWGVLEKDEKVEYTITFTPSS